MQQIFYYFKCNQKIELCPCFHPANLLLSNCHRVPQEFVVFSKSELDLVLKKCESGHPAFYLPIADRAPRGVGCVGFVCKSPPATAELSLISYT